MTQSTSLQWGILATGGIAGAFARGLPTSTTGTLYAVASRSLDKAQAFAQEHNAPKAYGSYEELIADPKVEAVYIATPHTSHVPLSLAALRAGKAVLCEKPIALNQAEAAALAWEARERKGFLMEAWMYRCHPQMAKVVELIREGAIGELRTIQSCFSFAGKFDPEQRLFNNALGGGGILDVGGYPVSFARLCAGAALGKPFANPTKIHGSARLSEETGIDLYASAVLEFEQGILAEASCGVGLSRPHSAILYGTKGSLTVANPWFGHNAEGQWKLILQPLEADSREITGKVEASIYGLEADVVAHCLAQGEATAPAPSIDDTLGNMAALDAWRDAANFQYEVEKTENASWPTLTRQPLAPGSRPTTPEMPAKKLPGLDMPLSQLAMGALLGKTTTAHMSILYDAFFEAGGNAIDCSYQYGHGLFDRLVGSWIRSRGMAGKFNMIVKGAHSPDCNPEKLTEHLHLSLDALGLEKAPIYIMHRDNFEVPVGEFIDVLNEHVQAGRIGIFGGSNWTFERLEEANAYAARKGLQGMSVLNNNFSLARMVKPVWAGCLAVSDPASRQWLEEKQFPQIAWSSQARGFFTDRAHPDKREDKMLAESWYSDDNFERRRRAYLVAEKLGVTPTAISLAYVLNQPFPSFALIGPQSLEELHSSFQALKVPMTEPLRHYLNLEVDNWEE